MYKIRWWQENGAWTLRVSRQIGPVVFSCNKVVNSDLATVRECSLLEEAAMNELKHEIRAQGGHA